MNKKLPRDDQESILYQALLDISEQGISEKEYKEIMEDTNDDYSGYLDEGEQVRYEIASMARDAIKKFNKFKGK